MNVCLGDIYIFIMGRANNNYFHHLEKLRQINGYSRPTQMFVFQISKLSRSAKPQQVSFSSYKLIRNITYIKSKNCVQECWVFYKGRGLQILGYHLMVYIYLHLVGDNILHKNLRYFE